jgi:hypothetical protein
MRKPVRPAMIGIPYTNYILPPAHLSCANRFIEAMGAAR